MGLPLKENGCTPEEFQENYIQAPPRNNSFFFYSTPKENKK